MNVEMIPCPACGNPMPANAEYCTQCGHTDAFVAPGSAVRPSAPRPDPSQSAFTAPVPPPVSGSTSAAGDTPQGGSPTVNIGAPDGQLNYTPPPPAYSPQPLQPGQAQPLYAPTQSLGQYQQQPPVQAY